MEHRNENKKVIKSFLAGAAIGIGLGILYAPYKGSKTRRKIRHTAVGTAYDMSHWLKDAKAELEKSVEEKKEDFENKLEKAISSMSYKADDIITALEDKLEDLKKQNKKLQK